MQIGEILPQQVVVHLDVYIQMPISIPRRLNFFAPDSLKVRGESAGTRRRSKDSGHIENTERKSSVFRSVSKRFQSLRCRQRTLYGVVRTQSQANAIEVALIVERVRLPVLRRSFQKLYLNQLTTLNGSEVCRPNMYRWCRNKQSDMRFLTCRTCLRALPHRPY
jgi:hypothetical protein